MLRQLESITGHVGHFIKTCLPLLPTIRESGVRPIHTFTSQVCISIVLQIELLWRRSLGDHDGRLFCLVNVDLVDYSVSQKAADTLGFLLQEPQYNRNEGIQNYLIVLIFLSYILFSPYWMQL